MAVFSNHILKALYEGSEAQNEALAFYPDTIPYTATEDEYQRYWQGLNQASKGNHFYVSGYSIHRVGFFRKCWETIRGGLGLNNHTNPHRTKMAMMKLAYYGYVKGYPQTPVLSRWARYRLDAEFVRLISLPRSDSNSAALQAYLKNYFVDHYKSLKASYWSSDTRNPSQVDPETDETFPVFSRQYKFGDAFLSHDRLASALMALDPQSQEVVDALIGKVKKNNALAVDILKDTKLARTYADCLVDNYLNDEGVWGKFKSIVGMNNNLPTVALQAAELDSTLITRRKDFYIKFYLKVGNVDKALELLLTAPVDMAVAILRKHVKDDLSILNHHLLAKTNLRMALVKSFLGSMRENQPINGEEKLSAKTAPVATMLSVITRDNGLEASIKNNSLIARHYAVKLIETRSASANDDSLEVALELDATIQSRYKELYVSHFLAKKKYSEALNLLSSMSDIPRAIALLEESEISLAHASSHIATSKSAFATALTKSFLARTTLNQVNAAQAKNQSDNIQLLVNKIQSEKTLESLLVKDSPLARAYADRLIDDYAKPSSWLGSKSSDPVYLAVSLDSTILERRKTFYIDFYIKNKAYADALKLITTLTGTNIALQLIVKNKIPVSEVLLGVKFDSPLAKLLVGEYMSKLNVKIYDPTKDISDTTLSLVSDAYLHETYPNYYFMKYVAEERYDEAQAIFAANETVKFDSKSAIRLAEEYHDRAFEALAQAEVFITNQRFEEAQAQIDLCKKSCLIAADLAPSDMTYKQAITRGDFLAAKMVLNSPLYQGDPRTKRLDLTIKQLTDLHARAAKESKEVKNDATVVEIKADLIKAIQERAKLLCEQCLDTYSGSTVNGSFSTEEHKKAVLPYVNAAINCFTRITKLNSHVNAKSSLDDRIVTAHAHFMISDLHSYFSLEINSKDYQRASDLVPGNPFYAMRAVETMVAEENPEKERQIQKARERAFNLLSDHNLRYEDYTQWYGDRWRKPDSRSSEIHDITRYAEAGVSPKKSWFSW